MTCQNCGATLKPDARFCGSCGNPVEAAAAAVQTATPKKTSPAKRPASKAASTAAVTVAADTAVTDPAATEPAATKPAKLAPAATEPAETAPAVSEPAGPPPLVAPWTRRRKIIVVAVAAGSVLVVAAAAIGIGLAVSAARTPVVADGQQSDSSSGGSGAQSDSEEPVTTADESDQPEEPVVAAGTPVEFASNSGNIRCRIDADGVLCRQGEIKYARPSSNCSSLSGTTIGLNTTGVWWPCIGSDFIPVQKVAYDTPVSQYGYTCSINYTTGVTCTNPSGNGFQMEYYAGVQTF